MMNESLRRARKLHSRVPADWYWRSVKENWLQRFWHMRRFREVGEMIEPAEKILDVGSADGMFTQVLAKRSGASEVVGVDVLESSVSFAKKRFEKLKKYRFMVADAQNLPFEGGSFDGVFCLEVVEHVTDPRVVMRELFRVLMKGGYAVVLVPRGENLLVKIGWWVWTRWRGKIWRGTHLGIYRDGDVEKMAKEAGFKLEEQRLFLLGMLEALKLRKGGVSKK